MEVCLHANQKKRLPKHRTCRIPRTTATRAAFRALAGRIQQDFEKDPAWTTYSYMIAELIKLNDTSIGDLCEANLAVAYYVHCACYGVPWIHAEIRGGVHIKNDRSVSQLLWYLEYENDEIDDFTRPPPVKSKREPSASPSRSSTIPRTMVRSQVLTAKLRRHRKSQAGTKNNVRTRNPPERHRRSGIPKQRRALSRLAARRPRSQHPAHPTCPKPCTLRTSRIGVRIRPRQVPRSSE